MQQKRKIMMYSSAVLPAMAGVGADPAMADLTPQQALGKAIFFDMALSINGNQSCADCHGQDAGWARPDSAITMSTVRSTKA
jgi:cytochrome c peroxidase